MGSHRSPSDRATVATYRIPGDVSRPRPRPIAHRRMVPFRVAVSDASLDDSRRRLAQTRWPGELPARVAPRRAARLLRRWRVLAQRLRLAGLRGGAQRVPAVHHHHRRPEPALPARALARGRRHAADADPRLARLGRRVHGRHRTAQRSARARRRSGRRLSSGDSVDPGTRVLAAARRARVDAPAHRARVHPAHAPAGVRALRGAGRRHRCVPRARDGPHRSRRTCSACTSIRWSRFRRCRRFCSGCRRSPRRSAGGWRGSRITATT